VQTIRDVKSESGALRTEKNRPAAAVRTELAALTGATH
jgi:hypothetical protein